MAATSRFSFPYPTPADTPDGPTQLKALADISELWAGRAYTVTDTNARNALSGLYPGFLVYQYDDDSVWVWSHTSVWVQVNADSSGGSSSGAAVEGQWRASSNQNLPNNTDTVLAFGTTEVSSSQVSRATSGSGHKFTLANDGAYAVTATVRFASGKTGSFFIELRNSAQTVRYVADGDNGGTSSATRNFSITKRFSAGQELVVVANQSTGSSLSTQYQGSGITDGFVRLTICKLSN